ncbi:dihydropteroate synthase [Edaphobacter modestus]|uniref:Dihydropteroate synthase n=1 Tax=Edaphobacter modestus TaxID=388466 RepID=A0A4Q7YUP5_9BACT|nr:dihydropteroate synthase [Edaphobacter modestus]RZU41497.1 dihydropteroate synthase [Edaphobacter modestus]
MAFASRPHYDWQLRTRSLALGRRTLVMGILNVTPDSFSDGGHFFAPEEAPHRALEHAIAMLDQGADLIDLGGESTRPGSTRVSADEEQSRVLPVLSALLQERPSTIVSIDTFHASTARCAVEAGAEIVNDVSGHLWDTTMSSTCARLSCGAVLMHTRGTPSEWSSLPPLDPEEIVPLILTSLEASVVSAEAAGVLRRRIVVDPGLGFGKRLEENYPILANLAALHRLKLPIMIGASRKNFLANTLAQAPNLAAMSNGELPPAHARINATLAANVAAILSGAHILRVHDVKPACESAAIADQILLGC